MKIKESLLLASIASLAGLPLSVQASPLVSIGDSVDVFFNGSSSVQWQSNVFYQDDDEEDDIKFTVSPGLEMNVGRGVSNADFSVITRYDIIRYDDLSDLDDELFHIKGIGSYKTSRWDVNGSVSFDEEQSATVDGSNANGNRGDGELINSDHTRVNLEGEYRLSPKFSVGSGVRYYDKEYTNRDDLADRESYSIPVDVFYELTPKVDLSIGYQYQTQDIDKVEFFNGSSVDSYDKESHFFNVGARGELLPKLTGFFKVGYRYTDPDSSDTYDTNGDLAGEAERDSKGTLGFDSDFTYLVTPKVTSRLKLHRGFGVGGEGQSTTRTSADLSASYAINANYSASAFLGYTLREYEESNKDDNIYKAGARLSYVPNQYWRFSTGYTYLDNDSDRDNQGYTNHIIDLSASLRY